MAGDSAPIYLAARYCPTKETPPTSRKELQKLPVIGSRFK